jgi:peptide/nickel transport system substrate-binding protein
VALNDDSARVNALLSGQVQAIGGVPYGQVGAIRGSSSANLLVTKANLWNPFVMNVNAKPFDDVRVRQAFRLIPDRPQLVKQALNGYGSVGNDLYSPQDPLSISHALPQRHQDIPRAKSLLKQAGHEKLTVVLNTSNISAGIIEQSQVLAAQARMAGVTIKLNQIDPGDYYGKQFLQYPFSVDYFNPESYLVGVAQNDSLQAIFPETHFRDHKFDSLYRQILGESNKSKVRELAHEMQTIQWERGGWIIWGFVDTIDAYSKKVKGFAPHLSGLSLGAMNFSNVWFS